VAATLHPEVTAEVQAVRPVVQATAEEVHPEVDTEDNDRTLKFN
jgi:hypothetical protein